MRARSRRASGRRRGPTSKATASNAAIAQLPRYLFETIAFGGIVLIVLYYLQAGQGIAQILPTISLYAFAGYRLMPELQQLFSGVASIRFNRGRAGRPDGRPEPIRSCSAGD